MTDDERKRFNEVLGGLKESVAVIERAPEDQRVGLLLHLFDCIVANTLAARAAQAAPPVDPERTVH